MTDENKSKQGKVDQLLDELLAECGTAEQVLGKEGLLRQMTQRLMERALAGELTAHLGYPTNEKQPDGRRRNTRNGSSAKTVLSGSGSLDLSIPRDRQGTFEPVLVPKGTRRLPQFNDQVIALYAQGLTNRQIQGHLLEMYGVEVSASLISEVTEQVSEEVRTWQSRTLEPLYPIVYFDALFVKNRQSGVSCVRAVYLALALTMRGNKELLGLWVNETEGAKFWLGVLTELQNRGMCDCLIACVDGLTGFKDAVQAVFPKTAVQLCVVHKIRSSLRRVPWRDRKAVAADLRQIYSAPTLAAAEQELERFAATWDERYAMISLSWRRDWNELTTFFDYPPEIRRVLYTTNAIESLNYSLRRILRNRGAFPDDASVLKLLYLAIMRASKNWTHSVADWPGAINRFAILFPDRINLDASYTKI
jgi:transposase-like protein